jgi:hypothetical protein
VSVRENWCAEVGEGIRHKSNNLSSDPTTLDDSVTLFYTANNARSILSAALTSDATSITLVDASKFASSAEILIKRLSYSSVTLTGGSLKPLSIKNSNVAAIVFDQALTL